MKEFYLGLLDRRPQELPRRQVLSPAEALAVKRLDTEEEYFSTQRCENRRDPRRARERALLAELPGAAGRARQGERAGFRPILQDVDPRKINIAHRARAPSGHPQDRPEALQNDAPPLGGLNATPVEKLAKLFISPGADLRARGPRPDWWRTARALFAGRLSRRRSRHEHLRLPLHARPARCSRRAPSRCGCTVYRRGPARPRCRWRRSRELRINAYVGTPSFLKLIVEKADELKADISCLQQGAWSVRSTCRRRSGPRWPSGA